MKIKKTFFIGDEWLFYKIYTTRKTSDKIITDIFKPVCEELINKNIIDNWFFIRYQDPKFHLRIRFHLTDNKFDVIINLLKNKLLPYIDNFNVHSIQIDTYKREIERYGKKTIIDTEKLFFYDSVMVSNMIDMIEGDEGEEIRWKFAIKAIDCLLNDFEFTINEKSIFFKELSQIFGNEFGLNKRLKKQLNNKFRDKRLIIESLIKEKNYEFEYIYPIIKLIKLKSKISKKTISKILQLKRKNNLDVNINDLLASYSHMLINRTFMVNPRLNEFVIYYLLHKYYISEIARNKYI